MPGGIPHAQPPPGTPPGASPGAPPVELPRVMLWRLRRNPLRRPTDLLQAWLGIGLLLAVLTAAPAALFVVGDAAHHHYAQSADRQERTRWRTTAVLVHDAPRHPEPGTPEEKQARYPVEVRFTDPGGQARIAETGVPPGLTAGTAVDVWADTHGRITGPPLTTDEIHSRSMGWAITAFLSVAALGATAYGAAALVLRRRNLAGWETAWAGAAPGRPPRR